jgi:hypothetical protein
VQEGIALLRFSFLSRRRRERRSWRFKALTFFDLSSRIVKSHISPNFFMKDSGDDSSH